MGLSTTMELLLDHWPPTSVIMAILYQGVIGVCVGVMDVGVNPHRHVKRS